MMNTFSARVSLCVRSFSIRGFCFGPLGPLVVGLLYSLTSAAQFKYIGGEVALSSTFYTGAHSEAYHGKLAAGAQFTYRPIRRLGASVSVHLPMVQYNSYNFTKAETSSGTSFHGFADDADRTAYTPDELDYSIRHGFSAALSLRYFFKSKLNFFVAASASFSRTRESFTFVRYGNASGMDQNGQWHPAVEPLTVEHEVSHDVLSPGLSLGLLPHVGERLFLDIRLGTELRRYAANGFTVEVQYEEGMARLESQARGNVFLLSFGFGAGYFF